jgi:hypothetical protein
MAYKDFTLDDLRTKFGIENKRELFENSNQEFYEQNGLKVTPSQRLVEDLKEVQDLPIRSEKAKSEWIVVPILRELRRNNQNFFTIYSGEHLNVNDELGLRGECDFILAKETGTFDINYPIIQLVEAKKNDTELGVAQCAAQMVGAYFYNKNKDVEVDKIYGCVTTGNEWLFMKLEDNCIKIDKKTIYLNELELILSVFQNIIDSYKKTIV